MNEFALNFSFQNDSISERLGISSNGSYLMNVAPDGRCGAGAPQYPGTIVTRPRDNTQE